MKIGKIDFNEKLKSLSYTRFKSYYKGGDFEKKTGVSVDEAAKKLGIKTPKKTKGE